MDVTFLCPANDGDLFYGPMIEAMSVTAQRLGIALEVVPCGYDVKALQEKGLRICERAAAPDYLLLVNENEVGVTLLRQAAQRGIRVLVFVQGFTSADRFTLGRPREQHASWIGQLLPDDRGAGEQLTRILVDRARRDGLAAADGQIHMIGISGPFTSASIFRLNGLRAEVSRHADVVLDEIAPAGWDQQRAYSIVLDMIERYPETAIIWAASDSMALGAAQAVKERGGAKVAVGGIDWAPDVPESIRRGEIAVSMGGHFFDGAWALLLLYDYHHGVDLPDLEMTSSLTAMTLDNVELYGRLIESEAIKRLDLSRFSRHLHPDIRHLDMRVEALL